MERGTAPTVAGVAVGDCNDFVANQSGSETEHAAGVALVERYRRALPLPVDAHDEPVAAALDAPHGARELVRLLVAEPDAASVGAVDVLDVVARVGAERARRVSAPPRARPPAARPRRHSRRRRARTPSERRRYDFSSAGASSAGSSAAARQRRPRVGRSASADGSSARLLDRSFLDLDRLEIGGCGCLYLGSRLCLGSRSASTASAAAAAAASASASSQRSRPPASASALVAATWAASGAARVRGPSCRPSRAGSRAWRD